jgi:acyl-CoA synthetase (NDP forming)/RimJ/RimL family protein N-acetyltransferase
MSASDEVPAADYPVEWEADVVLVDGATAHLRPIRPQDAEGLARFHDAQSAESIYLRFFAPLPHLPEKALHRFTHVDYHDRGSLVATVGGEIVGVACYDRIEPETAEAAIIISDDHHQRGLGSVLLEHLAAAARENDVHRFVADVLPHNRKMLGVLRDVGWELTRRYADGVISLSFLIDPTERSLAVMEAREHRSEAVSMHTLLNPRSVVVFGASRREGTIGHRVLGSLLNAGFTGELSVVHPQADAVLGVPAHRSLAEIPGDVDLAIIAVPAPAVLDVVTECAGRGVRGLVVLSGGFAEEGAEGLARQRELVRLARENGMRVVGPNSWGLVNADPAVRLDVSLLPDLPAAGRIGLFAQSAAGSVLVMQALAERGLGASTFVSTGNRADVSGNDCLQYWEEDERTDVVGMYLESIGNPRKFSRIARRLSRRKPIIVIASGQAGVTAPPGHAIRATRAPRRALDALLEQSGCLRVETVRQQFDLAELLADQPLLEGPRVAVVVNTPGLGSSIADACARAGLQPRTPAVVPTATTVAEFGAALAAAFAAPDVDAVVTAVVPSVGTSMHDLRKELQRVADGARQPVVACFLGLPAGHDCSYPDPAAADRQPDPADQDPAAPGHRSVPIYGSPEEAVRVLGLAARHRAWTLRDPGTLVEPEGLDRAGARAMVDGLLADHPDGLELDPATATRLMECYGVRPWPALPVTDRRDAADAAIQVGWPVALKTTSPQLRHRVDLGGVRLGIGGPTELADHLAAMQATLGPLVADRLVVQRMAPAGVACVVRTVEDPLFGPVVSFGLGGDASELLDDVAHRIPPLTDVDVAELVGSVRAAPKLFGHKGARPVHTEGLYDVITRVACLAEDLPEVAELELNPIVVSEGSVAVLDATVRLAPDPHRSDAGVRELSPP